jgi:hypothetical protein
MSGFFILDLETLGIESNCVCLSAAMLWVDPEQLPEDNQEAYEYLLKQGVFVKLNAKQQVTELFKGRTVAKNVLEWWEKQAEVVQRASFIPDKERDLDCLVAINKIKGFFESKPDHKKACVWVRGSLDQPVLESLLRSYDVEPFIGYNNYRDVRTAIDLIYPDTSNAGYVDVPDFEVGSVIKHHPTHDCAYDGLMLLRGKQ